jgi:hypothetical protein
MTAKQYRPIILKVLQESGKKNFTSVQDFADHLISKMEDFEDMFSLALQVVGTETKLNDPPSPIIIPGVNQTQDPGAKALGVARKQPSEDVSDRFRPKSSSELIENFTKSEVYDYYTKALPQRLEVTAKGCEKPIVLHRSIQRSPGDTPDDAKRGGMYMPNIKIMYGQPGAPQDWSTNVLVSTTDPDLDADRVIEEVRKQADMMFSDTLRHVEPRFTLPPPASLDATIGEGIHTETDANANDADLRAWGAPVFNQAASEYGKR